ncbi:T9SS type A sorting domain-containing protein [Vicingus serpentipes]|uniref:T9SS type A sorting domain-containing protein n=1 Tax=Vicingus serpentipes TaxID=1926625 RepID=A0A5C6RTJ8_9FLAO|nr:zinc-dependent metalloprotease [Vicingus serpentipes]TXB65319.1 T9SS type A sorting domain-containing protein [Vicingus serpentipes]
MKIFIKLFSVFYLVGSFITIQAQQISDHCGFNHAMEYQNSLNPNYKEQANNIYRNHLENANSNNENQKKAGVTYTIPVVFHVVWNSAVPAQNLADSVLFEQINVLNEDYSRTNADTSNLRPAFLPIVGTADIQFQLACKDPSGNPTNGIVRVQTDSSFGGGALPDMASISKIQYTSQGGSDAWNTAEYLNIWVGDINSGNDPSLLGIATPPAGLPNWPAGSIPAELTDGAIIQYNAFSRNNPNLITGIPVNGRTVTHEVGHYLGVRHCAENTFGGLLGSICGDDDGLNDTPNCDQSAQGCDVSRNSCTDTIPGIGDLPDMVENYMDYSDQTCQNSFTQGQVSIMRDVIVNNRAGLLTSTGLDCPTSIEENSLANSISVYPNPSSGFVNIKSDNANFKLTVYNNLGQEIIPNFLSKTQLQLPSKGIYFLKFSSEKETLVKKIVNQ